jgi:membrane-associated protease RseP (regulator of RpoE activity)
MKSIRFSLLGASAASALVCLSHAAPATFAPQGSAAETATEAASCQCACAACAAKHGAKLVALVQTVAPEAPAPKAVPELGIDIDAEVARILATDLSAVGLLLTDVTSADAQQTLEDVTNGLEAMASVGMSDERGYMGISLNMDPDAGGAIVGTVTPGSPAAKAGLLPGDVIVVSEEMPVESADELIATLVDLMVGDTATVEFERGGEERKVSIVLASRGAVDGAAGQRITFARPVQLVEEPIIVEFELEEPIIEDFFTEEEVEEEVEVVLPAVNQRLRGLGYSGGGVAAIEDVEVVEIVEEIEAPAPRRARVRMNRKERRGGDALPEGYIEIETRRERRPASDVALRERVEQLEQEVAELGRIVSRLRKELDRRNPR